MSTVVFPFKDEDPEVVTRNVLLAASHPRVAEVTCVGLGRNATFDAIDEMAPAVSRADVTVILQRRVGSLRPGKGDAMNTALLAFLEQSDEQRLHFYDADITNFDAGWIEQAEQAADAGFDVVRHSFPRASTDAMITWMITRIGFAVLWPDTELPRIGQPLGGELLLTREAAEGLASDHRVLAQSDWGVDTLYTFAMVQQERRLYETYVASGKQHRLYGGLQELSTMLVECFAAVQALRHESVPVGTPHVMEPTRPATEAIATKIGYDIDATLPLLASGWSQRQDDLLDALPTRVAYGMRAARQYPTVAFMDEDAWYETYLRLLPDFDASDGDWRRLLFKLWVARVLHYTFTEALRGHASASAYLEAMVERTIRRAARKESNR
ncbi:MAG: hypothetical protein GWP04_02890 [Gammaproteobacteria bacterium]|nr:hypothetical protein [Gammaproteobacteria bacterium]